LTTASDAHADHADDGESICLSCGLCCDGTMFKRITLALSDRTEPLARAGVVLIAKENRTEMPLRCAALDGTCCTIYADRPVRCGLFTCALHRRHAAGEISTDEALATITKTRELQHKVHRGLARLFGEDDVTGPGRSFGDMIDRMQAMLDDAPDREAVVEANSLTLLYATALDRRITALFRNVETE
jgi:Fe-S-cluster containining protein